MTTKQFNKLLEQDIKEIYKLCRTKGKDYARTTDRLSNFKDQAQKLDLTPLQIWGVYANKHWDAVNSFIKNGQVESEPIESRIHDLILYLFLLHGLINEDT